MKKHTLGVFLFGLATVISMTLLYGADLGRNWLEVSGSAAKEYRIPIRGAQSEDLRVALTFNGSGPEDRSAEILETLEEKRLKAAFFVTVEWAGSHPRELERIRTSGQELGLLGDGENNEEEVLAAREELERLAGQEVRMFRPRQEDCGSRIFRAAEDAGMRVLGWGLDSLDWKEYGKEELIRRIEGNLETGDIILCRTEPSATAEALGELTETLDAGGWKLLPLSELLGSDQGYTDRQGIWHPDRLHS